MNDILLQTLGPDGVLVGEPPDIPREDLRRLYCHMLKMRVLDGRMLSLQRQGRIGFYGTATGQEAAVSSARAGIAPACSRRSRTSSTTSSRRRSG